MDCTAIEKVMIERAVSVNLDERRPKSSSFIGKWKSFRLSDKSKPSIELSDGLFVEDNLVVETEEELTIQICKDTLRTSLLDGMRAIAGDIRILIDLEAGKDLPTIGISHPIKSVVLLWACFIKREDLLSGLMRQGAQLDYTLPGEGFTCLHLAAFSGCIKCVKFLINQGCDINLTLDKYSPIHYAVLGNSAEAVKLLLGSGAKLEDSMLHSAVRANALECLRILLARGCSPNTIDQSGFAPLHIAADRGFPLALRILLNSPKLDVNIKTRDKANTALHLSAENANVECVNMLLEKGASILRKNNKGQIPLHLASRSQCVECLDQLIKMGSDVNSKDSDNRTPLHAAVGKALLDYTAVDVLLRWGADINIQDRYGYTPLHIAAVNELTHIVDTLIMAGADVSARTRGGLSALSIMSRKTPGSLTTINKKLDSSLSINDPEHTNRELELKLDFRYLLQHTSGGEVGFLKTLIDEGQKDLLEHPLCSAFLYIKWQKMRVFYFFRLLLTAIFVLLLTLYVMTALVRNCYNTGKELKKINPNLSAINETYPVCDKETYIGKLILTNPLVVELIWYILLAFCMGEIIRKVFGISGYSSVRQYLFQWANIMEWYTIMSVFASSFIYTKQTYPWQSHIGALAVLCAWTNLMVMIGQLPVFGTYVAMFTKVQAEFAKLFSAYVCLIIGFTISFYVIFPSAPDFKNPIIGFVKVLVMMTGELDVELLNPRDDQLPLAISAEIIFIFFILFVTIVLMNLLVGIAVQDIQGLSRTAGLSKLVRQTELISFLEMSLLKGFLPMGIKQVVRKIALVAPQAYRVVLHLRPLNPRETRLPRDVMQQAMSIARKQRLSCLSPSLRMAKVSTEQLSLRLDKIESLLEKQSSLINNIFLSLNKPETVTS